MGQSTPSTTALQVRVCFTVKVISVEAATGDAWQEQRVKQSINSPSRALVRQVLGLDESRGRRLWEAPRRWSSR
ncbi:hypothetical protein E2C01_080301 [Portunus trituberculatus]|uniref:Uncharacterized protein n=1 Tax=Portunus trituberculatus TaxID=210409 RepID=A0A5B7IJC4_PORTR|nr:hypothetical protein [Portunus trituberculatus]